MKDIIEYIQQANEIQLNEIIRIIIQQYHALHTDREGAFISISTDPNTRNEELEEIIRFIRACYNKPEI